MFGCGAQRDNAERLIQAMADFGFGSLELKPADLAALSELPPAEAEPA